MTISLPSLFSSAPLRSTPNSPWLRIAGILYGLLGSLPPAENIRKAYELRDRASDREKFFIAATYETRVTGNLEKALQTCELWAQAYPREILPHGFLGAYLYPAFGQYEKGVEVDKQLVDLNPDFASGIFSLPSTLNSRPLDEAERSFSEPPSVSWKSMSLRPAIRHRFLERRSGGNGPGSGSGSGAIPTRRLGL